MVEEFENFPPDVLPDIALKLHIANGNQEEAQAALEGMVQLAKSGKTQASSVAPEAVVLGDFDTAGELLLQAYEENDGTWIFPAWIRLPEQAPDSEPWQAFWRLPGVAELAEIRRSHGLSPQVHGFGEGGSSSAAREN